MIPLWLFYELHYIFKNKKALLLKEDINKFSSDNNFFRFIDKKYNRCIFYHRFYPYGFILYIFATKDRSIHMPVNQIGGGLRFQHPWNTILNANEISNNFIVYHNVTLGMKDGKKPSIGNNVVINTGAICIGGIKIGDNSIIGAGAVVTKNVPENSVVVGNPARIIRKDGIKCNRKL